MVLKHIPDAFDVVHVRTFAKECNVTGFSGQLLCFYAPSFEKNGSILVSTCVCVRPIMQAMVLKLKCMDSS